MLGLCVLPQNTAATWLCCSTDAVTDTIFPVAVNEIVNITEHMMEAQDSFHCAGAPLTLKHEIGYHNTKEENLAIIETTGLMLCRSSTRATLRSSELFPLKKTTLEMQQS